MRSNQTNKRVFSKERLKNPLYQFWKPQSALGFPLKHACKEYILEDMHTTLQSCFPQSSLKGFGSISCENTHLLIPYF
ncbi:hypothetical protein AQUSIP_10040 [Aquicella siphonis]|uniref:Uncharacterized protein n=1 Tax=Aquicella siphonis TaxID=254247 RepID=A0A5E4PFU2_9COXI|nr:hypothetical protein AQUSIP_10040 [Aquicella siphonis]